MKRTYVKFTAYIDGLKKPLTKIIHYDHPSTISLELGNIKTHGWNEKVAANEINWYPPTSIKRINQVTFEE